jgi:uncharacterized protein YbcC (UPF0753/DUF2309 family)
MEWYIKKGVPLHLDHFLARAQDSGNLKETNITEEQLLQLLREKIDSISFNNVRDDIIRFIRDDKVLEIWSAEYFKDLIENIKFK